MKVNLLTGSLQPTRDKLNLERELGFDGTNKYGILITRITQVITAITIKENDTARDDADVIANFEVIEEINDERCITIFR